MEVASMGREVKGGTAAVAVQARLAAIQEVVAGAKTAADEVMGLAR